VSVILRDDSLVMKSNTVEIVIEVSPDDGPRTDELSWTFAAILIIIIIVLTVALILVLRKHRVGYDID
jgi:ABC-type phosphate transport system permease subunit